MAKLWEIKFRVRDKLVWIASVHNTQSPGLGEDRPDLDAVRAALPYYVKHMEMMCWSMRAPIGPSVEATIDLTRSNGKPYHKRIYCTAYDYV